MSTQPVGPHIAERFLNAGGRMIAAATPTHVLACACRVLNCLLVDVPPNPDDVTNLRHAVPEAKSQYRLDELARTIILDSLGKRKPPARARRPTYGAGIRPPCCGAYSMQEKRLSEVRVVIANFERRGLPQGTPNLLDTALDKRARIEKWIEAHACGKRPALGNTA